MSFQSKSQHSFSMRGAVEIGGSRITEAVFEEETEEEEVEERDRHM